MDKTPLTRLKSAKKKRFDSERPDAVAKVHNSGHLTARERITSLLDPETAVEFGSIAAIDTKGDWVPEYGGIDFIGQVNNQPVIASSTDYTDRGGGYGGGRLEHLIALSQQHRWPMVLFVDGGGSRARHPRTGLGHTELSGQFGRYTHFDGMAQLSGWVPTIAIVAGPSFAGHASIAGFSDFVIATKGSAIGMGGPPMVEAALGLSLTPNELAGAEMHDKLGGIDLLVNSDAEAINAAKRYLSFFEDRATGQLPDRGISDEFLFTTHDEDHIYLIIRSLLDAGSYFELRPSFATTVTTGFGRVNGKTVGVLANNSFVRNGEIDESGATKAARFVELCDSYEFPILSLIDSAGAVTSWEDRVTGAMVTEPGLSRSHARALMAHQHRTVPLISIQIGKAGGFSGHIMCGSPTGHTSPLASFAWPNAEIGNVDGFSATRNMNAFDDVIEPGETRKNIANLLNLLPSQSERRALISDKKHSVDTW
jgi:acetyl-CoA carboxylase carboxyltransferase component|tara:strand:+ start:15719 stop:17161 length:1443 start_codon:yes stop_codon:yes gene_type:complete